MTAKIQTRTRLHLTGSSTYVYRGLRYVAGRGYDVDPELAEYLRSQRDESSGLPYFETTGEVEHRTAFENLRRPKSTMDSEEVVEAGSEAVDDGEGVAV